MPIQGLFLTESDVYVDEMLRQRSPQRRYDGQYIFRLIQTSSDVKLGCANDKLMVRRFSGNCKAISMRHHKHPLGRKESGRHQSLLNILFFFSTSVNMKKTWSACAKCENTNVFVTARLMQDFTFNRMLR